MSTHASNAGYVSSAWNPWPVSIMAFFALAIAGAVGFVVFCSTHGSELVAADYYEQEIRYDSELGRIQRASTLPDPAEVVYDASAQRLLIHFPPAHAAPGTKGGIQLYRASSSHMDKTFSFAPAADGHAAIDAVLAPGPWIVKLRWAVEGTEYQVDKKIVVGK